MVVQVFAPSETLISHFSDLEDPRCTTNRKYALPDVIAIAIMAILSGAHGPTSIALWAESHRDFLMSLMPTLGDVPAKDVFRRVFALLKPQAFQLCFQKWIQSFCPSASLPEGDRLHVAIDGKTVRRSHDGKNGLGALHSVSAWAVNFGITLAQVATDQKSNEITAIPQVLELIELQGAIITIDAMGTQKTIVEQIVDGGADYTVALKGNHGKLKDATVEYFEKQMENDFAEVPVRRLTTEETSHGRVDRREYIQIPAPETLPGFKDWKKLKTIGVVIHTSIRNGKETTEVRFYISSLRLGIKQFAKSIRGHWAIENSCHWVLDVTYREDESRTRNDNARQNLAWLCRFTLSLLKQQPDKLSVASRRQKCGWNTDYLLQVLSVPKA